MTLYHKYKITLLALALFFLYTFLIWGNTTPLFTWPDEMANAYFAEQFAKTGSFRVAEPLNDLAYNMITPRSVTIQGGDLVPVGFFGMPFLYGIFVKLSGIFFSLFLTPVIAALGGLFLYGIVRRVSEERVAMLSAILLWLHPAYIYYASFSYLPNVPFVVGLLAAAYMVVRFLESQKVYFAAAAGMFLTLAVSIRLNELIWIVPSILVLGYFLRAKLTVQGVICGGAPLVLGAIGYAVLNKVTYGGFLSFGYEHTVSQFISEVSQISPSLIDVIRGAIFPFGFSLSAVMANMIGFVIPVQWLYIALSILALSSVVRTGGTQLRRYVLGLSLISFFLILYYGSWILPDTFTLKHSQVGISFHRYLLPISILWIPLIAYWLIRLAQEGKKTISLLIMIFVALTSLNTVFVRGNDSLMQVRKVIKNQEELREVVLAIVPYDAVIMTPRADKIVFPDRAVISQYNGEDLSGVKRLLESGHRVFYLIYKDTVFMQREAQRYFIPQGMGYSMQLQLPHDYLIYEITSL